MLVIAVSSPASLRNSRTPGYNVARLLDAGHFHLCCPSNIRGCVAIPGGPPGECARGGRSCRPSRSPLVEGADGGREKRGAAAVGARSGSRAAPGWQHGAGGDRRHRHRRAIFCAPGARTDRARGLAEPAVGAGGAVAASARRRPQPRGPRDRAVRLPGDPRIRRRGR